VDVVAEVAAARRDIETAVAEAQRDPRLQGIVERADDLPIDMRSDAEPPKSPKAAIPAQERVRELKGLGRASCPRRRSFRDGPEGQARNL
jgi:hypothetical protein